MYLDDVSLGGPLDDILHDIIVIKATEKLGLFLNNSKSEIICVDATVRGSYNYHSITWSLGSGPCRGLPAGITNR